MSNSLILVIDQGTFATRALAMDDEGNIHNSAFCKIDLKRRGSGMVEQDATEILESTKKVLKTILSNDHVRRLGVSKAGLATQRSSVAAWDKRTGKPFGPILSWQDRRTAKWLAKFNPYAKKIKQITGLPLSPHYGASKLRWYIDHLPEVKCAFHNGNLAFGPLASFLLFHLLKRDPLVVDHANASRTQLWNIATRNWDPWLMDLFGVPQDPLPQCRPTCHHYGTLKMADIPVTAVNGDQTSAIYSLGQPRRDTAIVNMGTGAFLLASTGKKMMAHPTLLCGIAKSSEHWGEYIIEGTVNGAAAAIKWAADTWNLPDMIHNLPQWLSFEGEIPLFINTIGGLGSPWWKPESTPILIGQGELWQKAVAVVESIVFLLQVNLEALLHAGLSIKQIQIGGGLASLDGICQLLSDLSKRPVYRPAETEATARGIAWLAIGGHRRWKKPGRGRIFRPRRNDPLIKRYKEFCHVLEAGYNKNAKCKMQNVK